VRVQRMAGRPAYRGSLRNGIQSEDRASWGASFAVLR
jgi:hypothetical protein